MKLNAKFKHHATFVSHSRMRIALEHFCDLSNISLACKDNIQKWFKYSQIAVLKLSIRVTLGLINGLKKALLAKIVFKQVLYADTLFN